MAVKESGDSTRWFGRENRHREFPSQNLHLTTNSFTGKRNMSTKRQCAIIFVNSMIPPFSMRSVFFWKLEFQFHTVYFPFFLAFSKHFSCAIIEITTFRFKSQAHEACLNWPYPFLQNDAEGLAFSSNKSPFIESIAVMFTRTAERQTSFRS